MLCPGPGHFPRAWTRKGSTPGQRETKEENQGRGPGKSFLAGPALDMLQPPGGLAAWPERFHVEILLSDCAGFLFINLISSLECVLVCLDGVEYPVGCLSPHVGLRFCGISFSAYLL